MGKVKNIVVDCGGSSILIGTVALWVGGEFLMNISFFMSMRCSAAMLLCAYGGCFF